MKTIVAAIMESSSGIAMWPRRREHRIGCTALPRPTREPSGRQPRCSSGCWQRGATLVLGGQALDGSYLSDGWWLVDGTDAAIPLAASGEPPPGRSGAELVVDLAADRLLLLGGRDGNAALADLWQLDAVSAARP